MLLILPLLSYRSPYSLSESNLTSNIKMLVYDAQNRMPHDLETRNWTVCFEDISFICTAFIFQLSPGPSPNQRLTILTDLPADTICVWGHMCTLRSTTPEIRKLGLLIHPIDWIFDLGSIAASSYRIETGSEGEKRKDFGR